MANLGEVKVPITFEITDTSKEVLRGVVIELLQEVLASTLHELVREEVKKALQEPEMVEILAGKLAERIRLQTGTYRPRTIEYKSAADNPDLPPWARNGQWS
jgi:hypothetical protein